jgi:hypothetical protein
VPAAAEGAHGLWHRYTCAVAIATNGIAMLRPTHCLAAICLAVLLLSGCGNKGDLVLPDQQPKKQKSQPAPAAKTPDAKAPDPGPSAGGSYPVH